MVSLVSRDSNTCFTRTTFSRIWLADLVQTKGLGLALWFSRYSRMALELCDALESAASDAFSGDLGEEPLDHVEPEAEVGVKCKWKRECA